jgi:hypothetical protein
MTIALSSKQPYEAYAINFDFTPILGVETIASAVITAVDQDSLIDVSATLLDATKQSNTNKIVSGWVQGGTTGHNYVITCRIVGSADSQYELDGILPVAEIPPDVGASSGVTLSSLLAAIKEIIQDAAYTDLLLTGRINAMLLKISGGLRLPDGRISPALPDLYMLGTVNTSIILPYVSLPTNYQRQVVKIYDSSNNVISPPRGGGYSAFGKFMNQVNNLGLAETGSIYLTAIKGNKVFYQGIPTVSTTLGIHYYRKPATLALDGDEPEGIPSHLAGDLLKHGVIKEIYGDVIEAGVTEPSRGMEYHTRRFYELLTDLCDFVGIPDAEPQYYGEGGSEDRGACD